MAKKKRFFTLEVFNTQTNKSTEHHGLTLDEVSELVGLTRDEIEDIIGCDLDELESGDEFYLGESGFYEYYMIYDGSN